MTIDDELSGLTATDVLAKGDADLNVLIIDVDVLFAVSFSVEVESNLELLVADNCNIFMNVGAVSNPLSDSGFGSEEAGERGEEEGEDSELKKPAVLEALCDESGVAVFAVSAFDDTLNDSLLIEFITVGVSFDCSPSMSSVC